MRRGITIIWLLFLLLIGRPIVRAYDHTVTHPRLVSWSVQAYNLAYQPSLGPTELSWIAAGAVAEDQPILRTMNHFWWPQADRPLSVGAYSLLPLSSSPNWGWSAQAQSDLIYGPAFSWQQAVAEYRRGRYQSAFIHLGHVLHLLHDNSVPAHVRNDPHELGDSLENWLWQHQQELTTLTAIIRPRCSDYYDCFTQLAQTINQNFFSQDTISGPDGVGDWPDQPQIKQWPAVDGYIIHRGYRLAYYQSARRRFILDDQVHRDYWSQIAPLAVGFGAELIRLFFIAVNDQSEVIANPAWWQRLWATWTGRSANQAVEIIADGNQLSDYPEPLSMATSSVSSSMAIISSTAVTTTSLIEAIPATVLLKRVIDGDTIELVDGRQVRYIGIDAPELAQSSGQASQCLAEQAKLRNQQLLANQTLRLVADSGGEQDNYGRLLRYVYAGDVFVNEQLAADGLARVFFCAANQANCPPAHDQARRQQISLAGQAAQQNKSGVYSQQCLVQTTASAIVISQASSTKPSTAVSSIITPPISSSSKSSSTITTTTSLAIKTDLQPPDTIITTDLPPAINTGTARFLLTATEPASFECRLNDQKWKTCSADYQLKNLVSGQYSLAARAIDLSGNIDPTPAVHQWIIDKQRPTISWLTKPSSTLTSDESIFAVQVNEPADLFCQLDGQAEQPCPTDLRYDDLSAGQHQLIIRARDLAGNYSAQLSYKWTIIVIVPPGQVFIDFPPDDPWFSSSTSITITGRSSSAGPVLVNGQSAQLLADNHWRSAVKLVAGLNNLLIWSENELDQAGPTTSLSIILDNIKPSSSLTALPETVAELDFVVSWFGQDLGESASGHLVFDVQYRLGSESWQPWLSAVDYTSAIFNQAAAVGQKISFRCRARDQAGNWENWPTNSAADTFTRLAEPPAEPALKIVISQLATRGVDGASDEFVELYNPNNQVVDLSNWRLQSKSAAGTVWINRLGTDGLPVGSQIEAGGYFLLASADYSGLTWPDYRHSGNWGLSDDGGHVRLVNHQQGIADQVGYNQADDPEGQPAIADLSANYSLQRKASAQSTAASLSSGGYEFSLGNGWDTDNNQQDFVEQPVVFARSSNQQTFDQASLSSGLNHLWHFNECLGSTVYDFVGLAHINNQPFTWLVGRYDCAGYQTWENPAVNLELSTSIDPAGVTLAYWWRNASYPNEGRGHEYLTSADGQIILGLTPSSLGSLQFWHYGQSYNLFDIMPNDTDWHLLVATQERNQIKFYIDGHLKFEAAAEYNPPRLISRLDLADENWPITRDQLAIWRRALSLSEIRQLYQLSQPLAPQPQRPLQVDPIAVYHWSFDEGDAATAYDNLLSTPLGPVQRWIYSPFNLGVRLEHPGDLLASLSQPIINQDVSLSFWWRNSSHPNEGRANIVLYNSSGGASFGLAAGSYGLKVYFNGIGWYPLSLPIDGDDWHHVALVYDSYAYKLSLYLDGRLRWQGSEIWLTESMVGLSAAQDNWPIDLDELTIWQGALGAEQVETIYELACPKLDE